MESHDSSRVVLLFLLLSLVGCDQKGAGPPASLTAQTPVVASSAKLAGSKTCRECHAEFYKLWSTSWHGLAMQPFTPEFAKSRLTPQVDEIRIGQNRYRVDIGGASGYVRATRAARERAYPIVHVMGGKNVYYFLTPLERGRLQVLPLAYDVREKSWRDMAASGVHHFPDRRDEALNWTDRLFTFNTACFNCHVTELATNHDLATDAYHTAWSEPGISCESCHGAAKEHLRAMERLAQNQPADDVKIIRAKDLSTRQWNDLCATCHAKLSPISTSFSPGDRFFDHFDLVAWEHPDYYPDGRDLGENYTYTSWLTSRCVQSGQLDCNHCHTASGRMRQSGEKSNQACLPCHERLVEDPVRHGHHSPGSKGNECVGCHMPTTRFAMMGRTDHSMRPPMPAATLAFQSPNACNGCHSDRDAAWSNEWVGRWYGKDYQTETIRRAELIDAARKRQWARLGEMLKDLTNADRDQVYKVSLVRLLDGCDDESKRPSLLKVLHDSSPLVRSAAVTALSGQLTPETLPSLTSMLADESRLVRIRAAAVLAALPPEWLRDAGDRSRLEKAKAEFLAAIRARSDDWASHAKLGNYHMEKHDFAAAAECFETAARLDPRQVGPWVNAAIAYSNMRRSDMAENRLRRALEVDPNSAAANFNLGLLLNEKGDPQGAEEALRAAIASDPKMASAAHNLGILLSGKDIDDAIRWCRKAHELSPDNPKYACTLTIFLHQKGNDAEAIAILKETTRRVPSCFDAHMLLGAIHEARHEFAEAMAIYRDAWKSASLSPSEREESRKRLRSVES